MPIDGSSSSSSFGPRHQRPADREHLLLAAGHRAGLLVARAPRAAGTARTRGRCPRGSLSCRGAGRRRARGSRARSCAGSTCRPSGDCEMPSWTISCGGVSPISSPSNLIEPSRGGVRPEIERSVVDLPAPLEPISVTISPSSTVERDALQRLDVAVEGVDRRRPRAAPSGSAACFPR